jgi:N-acetylmuramoyl-L-alanine amidase-like protein
MTADVFIARFTTSVVLPLTFIANLAVLNIVPAFADEPSCAHSTVAPQVTAASKQPSVAIPQSAQTTFQDAGQLIASLQNGRYDVPRVELAARLSAAGFATTDKYQRMRENAARELAGRPDGVGDVSADELRLADAAIARQIKIDDGTMPRATFAELARLPGRPQIDGLTIIYLNPLGDPAHANAWKNIIAHQTEGPPGSARNEATDQFANPTKRGVMLWVETDGSVYWATAENAIPTHTDGGDRDDNKYIDNSKTYHVVNKTNSIGVEFIGNYPDVAKPVTPEQVRAWLLLVPFLQERYGISPDHIYAHNWIDFKDQRYCEGCELAALARKLGYCPSSYSADVH